MSTSLIGRALLAHYPGQVAVGVRTVDPQVASLLGPGQRVRLLGADPTATRATQDLGTGVVLSVVRPSSGTAGVEPTRGPLLVLALDPDQAAEVATASAASMLAVVLLA